MSGLDIFVISFGVAFFVASSRFERLLLSMRRRAAPVSESVSFERDVASSRFERLLVSMRPRAIPSRNRRVRVTSRERRQ